MEVTKRKILEASKTGQDTGSWIYWLRSVLEICRTAICHQLQVYAVYADTCRKYLHLWCRCTFSGHIWLIWDTIIPDYTGTEIKHCVGKWATEIHAENGHRSGFIGHLVSSLGQPIATDHFCRMYLVTISILFTILLHIITLRLYCSQTMATQSKSYQIHIFAFFLNNIIESQNIN